MTSFLPISLPGATLNERRRQLNDKIREAVQQNVPFHTIRHLEEKTPLDGLFKIGYAVATRNLSYVLETLQNRDLLFVSKALCPWLLHEDFEHIINPKHLEESVFPKMTTTAVNKMKHWIALNLRDSSRSAEFYKHYEKKEFNLAIKFLYHCSEEFIASTVPDILDKLTPHTLKILGERYPKVIGIYFDSFKNEKILKVYLDNHEEYINSLKYFLKSNPDTVLDLYEKFYVIDQYKTFSSDLTRYIMTEHKHRFNNKPELYTRSFLDIKTLAKCLNEEEIKNLIYKLARAEYISSWFTFQNVEPLLKRLKVEEQNSLKNEIFVEKKITNKVEKWPYQEPKKPEQSVFYESQLFQDKEDSPDSSDFYAAPRLGLTRRKFKSAECFVACAMRSRHQFDFRIKLETYLENLFEQYRFHGFEKTFTDLRKKMNVETMKNRQSIMLVLVSKAGGRPEHVDELMKLLIQRHENEPIHVRASVIRSLVKRCFMWRLPEEQWKLCLKYARDLGLDGKPSDVACTEGLHAVVLRNLLSNTECDSAVRQAYLKDFSFFKEYSLTAAERRIIENKLPSLLLSTAKSDPEQSFQCLEHLLTTLAAYKISPNKVEGVTAAIKEIVKTDPEKAKFLLKSLYDARVSRKELFEENFVAFQTDTSYLNALKHDTDMLKSGQKFEALLKLGRLGHEKFLRKLSLWFSEEGGLADVYFALLQKHDNSNMYNKEFARSLAILARNNMLSVIKAVDASKDKKEKKLCAALKSNAHLARPLIDIEAIDWDCLGTKAIANQVTTYGTERANQVLQRLLAKLQTQKLALLVSLQVGKEYETFCAAVKTRPKAASKTLLKLNRNGKELDTRIWDVLIETIGSLKIKDVKDNDLLQKAVQHTAIVPKEKIAEYCAAIFEAYSRTKKDPPVDLLRHISKNLEHMDETFVMKIIEDFVYNKWFDFIRDDKNNWIAQTYVTIFARFLMLSLSEASLQRRLSVGKKLFDRIQELLNKEKIKSEVSQESSEFLKYLDKFLLGLKYTKVFLHNDSTYYMQVFENVINWMQSFMPREQYFEYYTNLHLTMLYSKAIKQSIKNNPDIFKDLNNKMKEAVEIVGLIFGRYIANEVCKLREKYFSSIIHLYKMQLDEYIRNYFISDEVVRREFIAHVMIGILDGKCESHAVVDYMYNQNYYGLDERFREVIPKKLKDSQNQQIEFFVHARSYEYY